MSETLLRNAVRLHQAGDLLGAERLYGAVLRASPKNAQALYLLGFIHFQRGQYEDSQRLIGKALALNPHSPDAWYNRGCALQRLNRQAEAVSCFDSAVSLKPDYDEAWTNRGVALLAQRLHERALESLNKALALKPRDLEALSNRGTTLFELKRYEEAAADYDALFKLAPDFPYAAGTAALCRAYACDWRSLKIDRERIHAGLQQGRALVSPHASTLIVDDPSDQLRSAQAWVAGRCPESPARLFKGERYHHEKIRVAYLSADFHSHATAHLAVGLFESHDRARFETVAFSFGPDDASNMRERLTRAFDRFVDVRNESDEAAASLIRDMEIDIAVDLKGFTQDARPGILAFRPAPVQVNYLGHPGTMGASYIDYLIADRIIIPEEHEQHYNERIVLLPDSYQANDSTRQIAERTPSRKEEGLPESGLVFCSFNGSFKITPTFFDIWMRLLNSSEGSVLWLLDDNPAAVRNLKREAEARGVPSQRLVFAPRQPVEDHLARHRFADLFLDTLPCNAHTTASDALWAGLPLLTCVGTTFAGRVAASLLTAVGLPELIAGSLSSYEALALKLAGDPGQIAALKAKLAQQRTRAPLFDTPRFTRHLESAFTTMWERQQAGMRPARFAVAAEHQP
jgi:predicted O-linked N-acetylglucosamine transferase (SPINDLY family)